MSECTRGYGAEGNLGRGKTTNCDNPALIPSLRKETIQQCYAGRHLSIFVNGTFIYIDWKKLHSI